MIKEFKTGNKIITNMDCVPVGNFVLSKETEAMMVTHKFPLDEKVSIIFKITENIEGNVMMDKETVNRLFDDKGE